MASNRPEDAIAAAEQSNSSAASFKRFPNKPFPHSMLLVFEEYDFKNFGNGEFGKLLTGTEKAAAGGWGTANNNRQSGISMRSSSSLELPFPKQLVDNSKLQYNDMKQNPLIESAITAIKNGSGGAESISAIPGAIQNLGKAAASADGTGLGSALESLGANPAGAASAAVAMLRRGLPDFIGDSLNLATGQVLNPRETLAFEGVALKSHTFNWDLYPSNREDSQQIQDIIRFLKRHILPVTQNIGDPATGGIAKAFLKFPHICKIYLTGVDSQYYMKFKPAMITDMTVDYGAGGQLGIMAGGRPAGVNIALSFQELQIETAEDYGAQSEQSPDVVTDSMLAAAQQGFNDSEAAARAATIAAAKAAGVAAGNTGGR